MQKLFAALSLAAIALVILSTLALADSGWGSSSPDAAAGLGATSVNASLVPSGSGASDAQTALDLSGFGEELGCCLSMPCVCEISQVALTISCCCTCDDDCEPGSKDPIVVTFLDKAGNELANAKLGGPWCGCEGKNHYVGKLSAAIDPALVAAVRFTKPGEDKLSINGLKLKVSSSDDCQCPRPKWWNVLHCKTCCAEIGGENAYIAKSWDVE